MEIATIEVSGFVSCFNNLRKPFKKECRSEWTNDIQIDNDGYSVYSNSSIQIHDNDLKLLQSLIRKGPEHAKSLRLINVTLSIRGSRAFWQEMDTYLIGVNRGCSESTMHTLMNEEIDERNFHMATEESTISHFKKELSKMKILLDNQYISKDDTLMRLKMSLPEGWLQTRDINFNYQALRNIYRQRKDHRMTEWQLFCHHISNLPLAEELILID